MSFTALRRAALFGCATALSAIAITVTLSAQAAPAATHDATFDVGGSVYAGVTTFSIDKAGKVSGEMKLSSPAIVNAKLNGEVKDGMWKFNYNFTMDNQGQACSGIVAGTAKVTADASEATGEVSITGDCSPDPLTGSFTFKKKAK